MEGHLQAAPFWNDITEKVNQVKSASGQWNDINHKINQVKAAGSQSQELIDKINQAKATYDRSEDTYKTIFIEKPRKFKNRWRDNADEEERQKTYKTKALYYQAEAEENNLSKKSPPEVQDSWTVWKKSTKQLIESWLRKW